MNKVGTLVATMIAASAACAAASVEAADFDWSETGGSFEQACGRLPTHHALQGALDQARAQSNGGFGLDMWATVVNRDGVVCAVAYTGANRAAQWPGSRNISAQKANTANSFSLPQLALSTANLYAATQPGGTLFGLQASNPVDPKVAYRGPADAYGTADDPMVGHRIGGVNVFGGGLALYDAKRQLIGALGVSGDTSCADHNISWRTRHTLQLDFVPGGVSGHDDDNINYIGLVANPSKAHDFSHPVCKIAGVDDVSAISAALPAVRK